MINSHLCLLFENEFFFVILIPICGCLPILNCCAAFSFFLQQYNLEFVARLLAGVGKDDKNGASLLVLRDGMGFVAGNERVVASNVAVQAKLAS